MERRLPSIASSFSSANRSSIRRRSGNLHSDGFEFSSESSSSSSLTGDNSQDWSVDEYGDTLQYRPTVLLVHPVHPSQRHPSGPRFPLWSAPLAAPPMQRLGRCFDGDIQSSHVVDSGLLNPSNPTPRPESTSPFHHQSSESLLSLPTPDFTATHSRSFRSALSRLDFLSLGEPFRLPSSAFTMVTPGGRPQNVRTESDYSTSSANSGTSSNKSSNSADSGHSYLVPSINTTDKFTNKWPRPRSFRYLPVGDSDSDRTKEHIPTAPDVFEEVQGFGETSNKWTLHKWYLLMSVITVFLYGTVCLTCAIMVWLRSMYTLTRILLRRLT
jgi:hypothetical protein